MMLLKKTVYDKLVAKVNNIGISGLQCNNLDIEKKVTDHNQDKYITTPLN